MTLSNIRSFLFRFGFGSRMIVKQCLKAADLNHAFMPWDQHLAWSFRVTEEFYQQGDEEERRGLPISPLCSRSELPELPRGQAGFISFVVMVSQLKIFVNSSFLIPICILTLLISVS